MRFDLVTEGIAALFRAWDQDFQSSTFSSLKSSAGASTAETEQERKRRQLRESLRVLVKDHHSASSSKGADMSKSSPKITTAPVVNEDGEDEDESGPDVWNTPLEKMYCIKQVLDMIASVAEDHLVNGQTAGFVQKRRPGKTAKCKSI